MNISITDVKPEELENVYNFLSRFFSKNEVILPKPVRPEEIPTPVKEEIGNLNTDYTKEINWIRLTEFCKRMNINANTVTNAATKRNCFACKKVGRLLYIDDDAATKYYSRGRKYAPIRNTSSPATKQITPYIEWRDNIFEKIDKTPYSRNQMLTRLYDYMRKNYGVVWEQISKECRRRTGKVMTATIWLAWYWETELEPKHAGLTAACLDTVIAEKEREWNTSHGM